MPHAGKGMGGAYASASHVSGARKNTKTGGGKGVSEKTQKKGG